MNKMVWCILLQLVWGALQAQYKEFPRLQKLFDAGKYDKCIDKATGYAKDKENSKEPMLYIYIMKSWLEIAAQPDHEDNKNAVTKALAAGLKAKKKDKEDNLFDTYIAEYELLHAKAFEKAGEFEKDGKCPRAVKIYDDIQELYADRLSNYRKSLCMLQDTYTNKDGFTLLRNTILGVYKDYKAGNYITPIPGGFARLANEYLARQYFYNAEDILRKGMEVFPGDTAIRRELVAQTAVSYNSLVTSDFSKDLLQLRDKLLWADSNYRNDAEIANMLKVTNTKIITNYIKFNYDSLDKTLTFINDCVQRDVKNYAPDSINKIMVALYSNSDVRRIEGALDNLTRVLITYNEPAGKQLQIPTAQYVFNYILGQDNYEVAAYFIRQSRTLYAKEKKMLDKMQADLENKLVEILMAAPKEAASLDLAKKLRDIAPNNNKLSVLERDLYRYILKQMAEREQFSAFATTVRRGLNRFPADIEMLKLKKEVVIKDYQTNFLPNLITDFKEMKVITHVATCTAGKVDSVANNKFLRMLNYLRRQAGAYDSCILDAELNEMAQQAALMMKARNELDHSPDSTWKCFTQKGKRGAGSSNLSLGYSGTDALLGQVEDEGEGNYSVGHRRWVLNPYNRVFGHGSTDNTMALYVFGKLYSDPAKNITPKWDDAEFMSWPPRDYAPKDLVFSRWSFSLANASFDKAKITVTVGGKQVKLAKQPASQGYGLNTLVWQMNDDIKTGMDYTVTVSNVFIAGDTKAKTYTYKVQVLDIE